MSRLRLFHTLHNPPPEPTSEPFAFYSINGTGHARIAARQTSLEPATGGADRAMTWSGWFISHNISNLSQRLFTNGAVSNSTQQYSCNINAADDQTGQAALFNFTIFNTGMTAFISIRSSQKILRSRLYFYTVTYDGSGSQNGFKLYLNSVEDTAASKVMSGAYTTAGQHADWRYQTGYVNGAASGLSFRGRQKNHAIWLAALTQTEVTELFNLQAASVAGASFYAAKVVAYWPLAADANCFNSATFNFSSVTNIIYQSVPFGVNYIPISVFNGIVPNTRYVAFGTMFKKPNGKFACKTRSGTDHVTNGKIIDLEFDTSGNMSVSAPVDILTDAEDLRNAQALPTDGTDITFFSATWSGGAVTDVFWVKSTDGLTGLTYGSKNSVGSILPGGGAALGLTYGKLVPAYVAGEYVVPWYSGNVAGVYKLGLLRRSAAGVWSYVVVYSGATALVEPALLRAENNTYIIMARLLGGNKLYQLSSTDDGVTWSAPAVTNMGTGECMADMCLMPNTRNIVLCYCDRGTGIMSISHSNKLADILASPLAWNAKTDIFKANSTDAKVILGYPSIIPDGYNIAGCVSTERSLTVADIYFFYGQIDFV